MFRGFKVQGFAFAFWDVSVLVNGVGLNPTGSLLILKKNQQDQLYERQEKT